MKNLYFPITIPVLVLTSTMFINIVHSESIAREDNTIASNEKDNGSKAVLEFNCQSNEPLFADYSRFFKDKDYTAWCEECIKNNGKPQVSYDVGPFCNLKTTDAGKICTDSEQCEGYCIAEEEHSNSGMCTEYQQLGDGCGWLEVIHGEVAELCVS